MASWREAAAKGEWDAIEWEGLSDDDQVQLLKILQAAIPKHERTDGYERVLRHDTPGEAKLRAENEVAGRKLTGRKAKRFIQNETAAAIILINLEARFGDDVDWAQQVIRYAQEILGDGNVGSQESGQEHLGSLTSSTTAPLPDDPDDQSEHAPELTADAHARRALEHVADYKWLIALARHETANDDDAEWLVQMIKDAASVGYWAGRRIQTASGKAIEYEAVNNRSAAQKHRGSIEGLTRAQAAKQTNLKDKFLPAMNRMAELIETGEYRRHSAAIQVSIENKDGVSGMPKNGFSASNLRNKYRDFERSSGVFLKN
ncbi:MAG: hypothetical protein JJU09_06775 [Rhodobacteraceae bacterium]|nr:hypothetical protein [Paracoccaceae bacterium]